MSGAIFTLPSACGGGGMPPGMAVYATWAALFAGLSAGVDGDIGILQSTGDVIGVWQLVSGSLIILGDLNLDQCDGSEFTIGDDGTFDIEYRLTGGDVPTISGLGAGLVFGDNNVLIHPLTFPDGIGNLSVSARSIMTITSEVDNQVIGACGFARNTGFVDAHFGCANYDIAAWESTYAATSDLTAPLNAASQNQFHVRKGMVTGSELVTSLTQLASNTGITPQRGGFLAGAYNGDSQALAGEYAHQVFFDLQIGHLTTPHVVALATNKRGGDISAAYKTINVGQMLRRGGRITP